MNLVGLLFILLWKDTLGNDQGFQCNYGQESLTNVFCNCENPDSSTGTVCYEIEFTKSPNQF